MNYELMCISEKGETTAIAQFGWIPKILVNASAMSSEVRVVAEDIIARYILPLPTLGAKDKDVDEGAWTERLMRTIANVDQSTFESALSMTGLQSVYVEIPMLALRLLTGGLIGARVLMRHS